MLSVASSVFDLLGILALVSLVAKIILQDLCRTGIGWDDEVDEQTSYRLKKWLSGLPRLSNVAIRRCLFPVMVDLSSWVTMELHHFADASSKGYGTVSYLRTIDEKGIICCSFLYAKARLAPLKTVSIPMLELMTATLAAQIDSFLCSDLEFLQQQTSTFWTDSMSVLLMLNSTLVFLCLLQTGLKRLKKFQSPRSGDLLTLDLTQLTTSPAAFLRQTSFKRHNGSPVRNF